MNSRRRWFSLVIMVVLHWASPAYGSDVYSITAKEIEFADGTQLFFPEILVQGFSAKNCRSNRPNCKIRLSGIGINNSGQEDVFSLVWLSENQGGRLTPFGFLAHIKKLILHSPKTCTKSSTDESITCTALSEQVAIFDTLTGQTDYFDRFAGDHNPCTKSGVGRTESITCENQVLQNSRNKWGDFSELGLLQDLVMREDPSSELPGKIVPEAESWFKGLNNNEGRYYRSPIHLLESPVQISNDWLTVKMWRNTMYTPRGRMVDLPQLFYLAKHPELMYVESTAFYYKENRSALRSSSREGLETEEVKLFTFQQAIFGNKIGYFHEVLRNGIAHKPVVGSMGTPTIEVLSRACFPRRKVFLF